MMNFNSFPKTPYIVLFLFFTLATYNSWADNNQNKVTVSNVLLTTDTLTNIKNDTILLHQDSVPQDSANIYKRLLQDETDDLMENHPADDLYRNIWTRERLNPYQTPADSLPDSIYIQCSEFMLPVESYVTSRFGPRRHRYHYGTDLKLQVGDSVRASFSGKVRIIDYEAKGYGHYIVIRHNNGLETVYAHLSKVLVEHNQIVQAGEVIALGGNTGRSTGPHLHYEFRYLGNAIDTEHLVDYERGAIKTDSLLITKQKMFGYQVNGQKTSSPAKYYVVRKGDTLSRIASRNGTSVNTICRLSGISAKSKLRPGQRLRIR